MTTVFALSLSASLILLLLYPVFNLLVGRCRVYEFNRILILAGMSVAVVIPVVLPLLAVHAGLPSFMQINETAPAAVSIDTLVVLKSADQSYGNLIGLIICLYWLGVVLLLIRESATYIRLACIICRSERTRFGSYVVCRNGDERIAPFSWGKYIVVAGGEIEEPILIHEKAHIAKRHWIDVAFADLFCIFLWYNPFAWMLKNLMKLNHEYGADAKVIESDVEVLDYQRLLIAKAIGNRSLPIANNFALSKRDFRKRVLSMHRRQSSPKMKWIALLVVPALAVALYANATPFSTEVQKAFSSYSFDDFSSTESVDGKVPITTAPSSIEIPATVITQRIPSPINDPEPLLKKFEITIDAADKNLLPDKILARIEVDEEGNIERVTTSHDNNPNVRAVVDKATNGLNFEVVEDNGRKIKTRFVLPIRKSSLPY